MPSNIEIKAVAADWDKQFALGRALADKREILEQEDVFFNCHKGRLKLRIVKGGESYLIFYARPDKKGPKTSTYYPSAVKDPVSMKALLGAAFGLGKTIRKTRTLFLSGQTRIHFDKVEGLGRFIELEVCMKKGQRRKEGEAIAAYFMKRLGIGKKDLLGSSYADMLALKALKSRI